MSETNDGQPNDSSNEADKAEAKKADGQEPSLQQHHDPDTEADSASGGAAQ